MEIAEWWSKLFTEIADQGIGAFIGGLIGALIPLWFTLRLHNRSERRRLTLSFVNEHLSPSMLRHIVVLGEVRRRIQREEITIDEVAAGFWYPGTGVYYTGPVVDGFNEHQHIEAIIRLINRMAYLVRAGQIDPIELRAALREKHRWTASLLHPVAVGAARIARESGGRSSLLDDVSLIDALLGLPEQDLIQLPNATERVVAH